MATIRNINGEFYVEFYGNGLLFQKKAGPTVENALALKQHIEELNAVEGEKIVARNISWASFKDALDKALAGHYHHKSCERFDRAVSHFEEFLFVKSGAGPSMAAITPGLIEDYLNDLRKNLVAARQVHKYNFAVLVLKEIFDYSINLGFLNDNPCYHARFIKEEQRPGLKPLEQKVLAMLSIKRQSFDGALTTFMLDTGLDLNGWCHLRPEYFQRQEKRLVLDGYTTKNNTMAKRLIPLSPFAFEFLAKSLEHQAEESRDLVSVRAKLDILFKDLGGYSDLSIKDTFVLTLIQKRVELFKVVRLLGWRDIARAMRYFEPWRLIRETD